MKSSSPIPPSASSLVPFSWETLVPLWEQQLLGEPTHVSGADSARQTRIQELATQVRGLWRMFNARRDEDFDPRYMNQPERVRGYLASYLLANVARTEAVLSMPEVQNVLGKLASSSRLRVLDFGSGPLSATMGLLLAAGKVRYQRGPVPPLSLEVTAVERSASIFDAGKKLLGDALGQKQLSALRCDSLDALPAGSWDVALCSYTLNELPPARRLATLRTLFARLNPGGLLLVLEPGQDRHARDMSSLRDDLLGTLRTRDVAHEILAPCPHHGPCPLSSRILRKDWCWFRAAWTVPTLQKAIDDITGIEHGELHYSFFVIHKGRGARMKPFARVVSDPLSVVTDSPESARFLRYAHDHLVPDSQGAIPRLPKARELGKALLCTEQAGLESLLVPRPEHGRRRRNNLDDIMPHRGELVATKKEAPLRMKERLVRIDSRSSRVRGDDDKNRDWDTAVDFRPEERTAARAAPSRKKRDTARR